VIERLAEGDVARRSAEVARILAGSFISPHQRWSAVSVAETLGVPGTVAFLAADACAILRVTGDEAELLTIAVLPAARRKGVAAALLRACLAEAAAAGAAHVYLEVAGSNAAARALYSSAGFGEAGRRPGYYQGPKGREDAVLMACETARPAVGHHTASAGPPS
jgi:ribosomal-protein-alanine N-acetyltransferase